MYGNLGKNSLNEVGENGESLIVGLLPYGQDGVSVVAKDSNNPAWWLGIGGELTTFDPLRLAFDFAYGKADWGKAANGQDLTRQGWLLSGIAEYKLDYVTPGLIAWYGSGDNSDTMDGSERLPTLSPGWGATTLGWDGAYGISDGAVLSNTPTARGAWSPALPTSRSLKISPIRWRWASILVRTIPGWSLPARSAASRAATST